ncbi:MAG: toll/interleukin-1 receptor domain-containing protein [Bacteroidetes bacterium]|nr:toll/interleukin-1 receptor domain-containing protein [Bacteroidota bacterium]
MEQKYDIAISFDESQTYIAEIIDSLCRCLEINCYYYKEKRTRGVGESLSQDLQRIYKYHSDKFIVIISDHYFSKQYCRLEWQCIKEKIDLCKNELILVAVNSNLKKIIEEEMGDLKYLLWPENIKEIFDLIKKIKRNINSTESDSLDSNNGNIINNIKDNTANGGNQTIIGYIKNQNNKK